MPKSKKKQTRRSPEIKDLAPKQSPKGGDGTISNVLKTKEDLNKAIIGNIR